VPLYSRILGVDGVDKIPVHAFVALLGEFARGRLTGAQVQTSLGSVSGSPLAADEVTTAQGLITYVNGGGTAAVKLQRAGEVSDVLLLGESGAAYTTPAAMATRLGIAGT
jgi:hypothetical protein